MAVTITRGTTDPKLDEFVSALEKFQADHPSAEIGLYRHGPGIIVSVDHGGKSAITVERIVQSAVRIETRHGEFGGECVAGPTYHHDLAIRLQSHSLAVIITTAKVRDSDASIAEARIQIPRLSKHMAGCHTQREQEGDWFERIHGSYVLCGSNCTNVCRHCYKTILDATATNHPLG